MQSCPNIGGREVRRRLHIGYFSLFLTIATVLYIFIYNDGQRRLLVFFPSLVMGIVLFEALDKTCIVNAYFGIKNMGENRLAGTIAAGAFLKEFVGEGVPWVHFDIAGTAWGAKPDSINPKGSATGWGIRLVLDMMNA